MLFFFTLIRIFITIQALLHAPRSRKRVLVSHDPVPLSDFVESILKIPEALARPTRLPRLFCLC